MMGVTSNLSFWFNTENSSICMGAFEQLNAMNFFCCFLKGLPYIFYDGST